MFSAQKLAELIGCCLCSHAEKATRPAKAMRLWDHKTPYGIHPSWGALTVLTETKLPETMRLRGALVLLFHDFLEDTTAPLPPELPPEVVEDIQGMTFRNFTDEMQLIWERPRIIRLWKLYDKTSNLLDSTWMSARRHQECAEYLTRLCEDVEQEYPGLNIITIARAIAAKSLAP